MFIQAASDSSKTTLKLELSILQKERLQRIMGLESYNLKRCCAKHDRNNLLISPIPKQLSYLNFK